MSKLPPGWMSATFGEIADTQLGKMLSAKARGGNGGRPYLRNKNVQWGRIDVDDLLRMDFTDDEFAKLRLREGDLLVCEGGEVGRAAIWRGTLADCGYQKALHRVRPRGRVAPEYILYLLMHYANSRAFERFVTGSTIAHLPQEDLRRLPVPVPPLAEQRRIVAAIEEHLSRLDSALVDLDGVTNLLAGARKVLLAAAFQDNAAGAPLDEVARVVSGQTPRGLQPLLEGPIPYYKVGDMNAASREMAESRTYVDEHLARANRLNVHPAGTVIFPKRGGAIATNKKRVLPKPSAFDLNTMGIVPGPRILSDYLLMWLTTIDLAKISDGSNVPQINHDDVAQLRIPLPNLRRQRDLVSRTTAQLSRIDALTAAVAKAARRSDGLRGAILSRAFRGELVPQDPNDEPAAVLLKRIAAERAAAPKATRKRKEMPPA